MSIHQSVSHLGTTFVASQSVKNTGLAIVVGEKFYMYSPCQFLCATSCRYTKVFETRLVDTVAHCKPSAYIYATREVVHSKISLPIFGTATVVRSSRPRTLCFHAMRKITLLQLFMNGSTFPSFPLYSASRVRRLPSLPFPPDQIQLPSAIRPASPPDPQSHFVVLLPSVHSSDRRDSLKPVSISLLPLR